MLPAQQGLVAEQGGVVVVHPVGKQICEENAIYPRERKFQDVPFAVLFLAMVLVCGYLAAGGEGGATSIDHGSLNPKLVEYIPVVWSVALFTAMVFGIFFVMMLRAMPLCMVWTCLLCTPVVMAASGVYMLQGGQGLGGGILLACAAINLLFAMCYKHLVPMTAELLSIVAHVLLHHLGMLLIGIISTGLHFGWIGLVSLAVISVMANPAYRDDSGGPAVVIFFIMTWGLVTVRNLAYLSYCSVFGQWYFGERVSTIGSFIMASTKSFGSVCFGSLIIAIVRTLRYMADQAKKDDNAAMVIMGYVLSCLLACIEDMIEWFSSFAYVQCAIRGCSFCDAARATMHLCASANVNKIIMQMLSGSITFMGCLLSGVVGSVAALHVARGKGIEIGYIGQDGSWPDNSDEQSELVLFLFFGCMGGIMFGFFGSGNVMAVVEAGINTILVCWAERPGQLESTHPEVHARFMGSSERDLSVAPGISARQPALY